VALASEMAVTEAMELQHGLERQLGRGLDAVIVNALLPRRFTTAELQRIERLGIERPAARRPARGHGVNGAAAQRTRGHGGATDAEHHTRAHGSGSAGDAALIHAAVRAARSAHERSRFQHNQLARLRRRNFDVFGVPFAWGEDVDLAATRSIAEHLARKL
jgi:hypothetical protein